MPPAIGLLEIDLLIPGSGSLKDKRKVIRSIRDRVRSGFNVSFAEVGHRELRARSHLAFVTVCNDRKEAEKRLNAVGEMVLSLGGTEIVEQVIQWL